ncbi:30S ribosomal protein S18 [Dehalococcoidia bacterium]|nr:30S ribosomal protein S18 [Dehalococcoidia bacterium]MCL0072663.1 30S ribosomal protein S18 [Dehalococcoidia bacterium]MCL0092538.1 30S ribosomal protein S18 [Dehalococcoidia bacterium]MCL0098510.1 30S ribosomal protein S18 [Dehalococcoidia bacterium]
MRGKRTSNTRSRDRKGFVSRRKACPFCVDRSRKIDYKEPNMLRRFISDRGKMEPRHRTGVCAKHQRLLSTALKRARYLALLPYTAEHIRWSGGIRVRGRPA